MEERESATRVPGALRVKRVAVIVGTRPEAVKMAPVIRALAKSKVLQPVTVCTSQHADMVRPVLKQFGITRFHELHVMRPKQTLWTLAGRLVNALGTFLQRNQVDAMLVQGDTSSALYGAITAFYHQIPVGHVEAGLRTGNRYSPFPEEMNRKLIASLATWNFAPTREAVRGLRAEGITAKSIYLTGNTVVDALRWIAPRCSANFLLKLVGTGKMKRRLILVTCHRRESLGKPMASIASALAIIAKQHPDVLVLFPIHPNPAVRKTMRPLLQGLANVVLCEPLPYDEFIACLQHAWLVLSDSGGVQEEATALGKPVLVLREQTERPEGVRAGALKLVGANPR